MIKTLTRKVKSLSVFFISSLETYVSSLEMYIYSLEMCISSLRITFPVKCFRITC